MSMFPEDPNDPRLPEPAEELLGNWPLPRKDDGEWERLAARIDGQVQIARAGSTSDELLEAPWADLPEEEREIQRRSHPRMKRPSEGSLAQLAKASVAQHLHERRERDELARAMLSQAVKARQEARVQTTAAEASATQSASDRAPGLAQLVGRAQPVATHVAGKASPASRPRASEAAQLSVLGNASEPEAAAERTVAATAESPSGRQDRRMWIGVAFGLLGMAAAAMMYVRTAHQEVASEAVALHEVSPKQQAPAPPPSRAPVPAPSPVLNVEEVPVDEGPAAGKAVGVPRASKPQVHRTATGTRKEVATAHESASPEPPPAGPSEPGMVMADSQGVSLPDKPSTGAVQVAVGSVMGSARACVAGQGAPSRASVQFGSDGRVASVAVSGPAAGTEAEGCIKTALGRARVQPFSRAAYVVHLTVRPQ